MNAIRNVYKDLSDPSLLKKCLHGRTQNNNESFNNLVWSKIPKNIFVRLMTCRLGVFDAILSFNDGASSKLDIYKRLGLKTLCSVRSVKSIRESDVLRVRKADKAMDKASKDARQERRKRKLYKEKTE